MAPALVVAAVAPAPVVCSAGYRLIYQEKTPVHIKYRGAVVQSAGQYALGTGYYAIAFLTARSMDMKEFTRIRRKIGSMAGAGWLGWGSAW